MILISSSGIPVVSSNKELPTSRDQAAGSRTTGIPEEPFN